MKRYQISVIPGNEDGKLTEAVHIYSNTVCYHTHQILKMCSDFWD